MNRTVVIFAALFLGLSALLVSCPKDKLLEEELLWEEIVRGDDTEVDFDFLKMSATISTARLVELMRSPQVYSGRTIRLRGWAVEETDKDGNDHYGIMIYDQGGCCPIATIEYFPASTNALPEEGARIVLSGTVELPTTEAYSHFIITGAKVRHKATPKERN